MPVMLSPQAIKSGQLTCTRHTYLHDEIIFVLHISVFMPTFAIPRILAPSHAKINLILPKRVTKERMKDSGVENNDFDTTGGSGGRI